MLIPASKFVQTAFHLYEKNTIKFKKGGKDLYGMDSCGFIEFCLRQNGQSVSFSGTNDIYRKAGASIIPLEEALNKNLVVPGTLLFCVNNNGNEPAKYKADQLGDAEFATICIAPRLAVYPSEKVGKLIETRIEVLNGKTNKVMFCKYIDYGDMVIPISAIPMPISTRAGQAIVIGDGKLRLRKTPVDGEVITSMSPGTILTIISIDGAWANVYFHEPGGCDHIGWAKCEFLEIV